MNNVNPLLLGCGLFCLWPLIVGALPTFLIMRYRVRLRSPIVLAESEEWDQLAGYSRPEIKGTATPVRR